MSIALRPLNKVTDGERARALAFFLCGICSSALGFLAVLHLDKTLMFSSMSWYQIWIVLAAGIGGVVALFLSGDRLGQSGKSGVLRGIGGAIWVTFIGSLIGGTLGLPVFGTMFGPFIVVVTLLGAPLLALLWVFNLFGIHMLLGIYQRERDSIFEPPAGPDDFTPTQAPRRGPMFGHAIWPLRRGSDGWT